MDAFECVINIDKQIIKDFKNNSDCREQLMLNNLKCEENCVKNVIETHTGNPLTLEDVKKIKRLYKQGNFDKYILIYNDIKLGMVRFIAEDFVFKVKFTPNDFNL